MSALIAFFSSVLLFPAPNDEGPNRPPVEIAFQRFCGPPEGQDEYYDPKTMTCHIHFPVGDIAARISRASEFQITRTSKQLPPTLRFRLTGVPAHTDVPLELHVDDKIYHLQHEKKLVRIDRSESAVTIEFGEEGLALIKPGTRFSFVEMHW